MFKKILKYFVYTLLLSMIAAYFVFSTILTKREERNLSCKSIKVVILDSAVNQFVTKSEILELLRVEGITPKESKLRHINQYKLECILSNRSVIRKSDVCYTRDGILIVNITQRRPILRLETPNGGFYMDETAYIFPLVNTFTSYVPIVSGNIPITLRSGHRGKIKDHSGWTDNLKELGLYLNKDEFWDSMVEQIYIDEKGVAHLTPRIGQQDIIFGHLDNIENKFRKLYVFYQEVMPVEGWNKYGTIDLQYNNQIVCKKREKDDAQIEAEAIQAEAAKAEALAKEKEQENIINKNLTI